MDMPLRVVQNYMMVDGQKVWTTYTLEVLGEWGWEPVPVVEREVGNAGEASRIPVIYEAGIMKC
jgi:hypothetical protein